MGNLSRVLSDDCRIFAARGGPLAIDLESQCSRHFGVEIIGESSSLKRVLNQVETVAPTGSAVVIQGETGTGKELIARAIHNMSSRRGRAFVNTNCASIPAGLLESELFGHERGAYTDAVAKEIGRFELANDGTVFLDEVGDIPLELQVKLLRILQQQEFERLGSPSTIRVNFRLVTATNRDLAGMVAKGEFRSDLYYRLSVFPIQIAPLRERPEDIAHLVRHFARKFSQRMNRRIEIIRRKDLETLTRYHWPGNVRELQNTIERCVILSQDSVLCVPELSDLGRQQEYANPTVRTLAEAERAHILRALRGTDWVIGGADGAAARLGVKRTTLLYKMRRLGISRPVAASAVSTN
ncbi:MAG: sigma 54-interacting transcriptional regulator [Candidatus Acidiferrales bacterium]